MATTIENEPCYIFHVRDYQENSLIVEALSPNYGAMNIIVRGARNNKSPLKGVFEPFVPLSLTVVPSRGDLYFLQNYERHNEGFNFPMPLYFCAMYVNELLHHLYRAREGDVKFFSTYICTLEAIAARKAIESSLRQFEFELLAQMGYSLSLWDDQGRMLNARDTYRFCFGAGFVRFNEYLFEKAMNLGQGGRSFSPPSWGDNESSYGSSGYDSSSDYGSDDGLMFSKSRVRGRRMESIPRNMGYGSAGQMGYENRAPSRNTEQDELLQKYYNYAADFMGPVLSGEQIQDIISLANRLPDAAKNAKALTSAIINRLLNGREVVSRRMYREYNQMHAQKKAAAAAATATSAALAGSTAAAQGSAAAAPSDQAYAPVPAEQASPAAPAAQATNAAPAAQAALDETITQSAAASAVRADQVAGSAATKASDQPSQPAEAEAAPAAPAADIPCDIPPPAWSLALNAPGAADVPPPAWSLALNPQASQTDAQGHAGKSPSASAPATAQSNPVVQAAMNFASGQTNPYFEQGGEGARMMEAIMPSGATSYVSQFASMAAQNEDDYEDIPEFELRPDQSQDLSIGMGREASAVTSSQDHDLNLNEPQTQTQSDSEVQPASETDGAAARHKAAATDLAYGSLKHREQALPSTDTLDVDAPAAAINLRQDAGGDLQVSTLTAAAAPEPAPQLDDDAQAAPEAKSDEQSADTDTAPEAAAEPASQSVDTDAVPEAAAPEAAAEPAAQSDDADTTSEAAAPEAAAEPAAQSDDADAAPEAAAPEAAAPEAAAPEAAAEPAAQSVDTDAVPEAAAPEASAEPASQSADTDAAPEAAAHEAAAEPAEQSGDTDAVPEAAAPEAAAGAAEQQDDGRAVDAESVEVEVKADAAGRSSRSAKAARSGSRSASGSRAGGRSRAAGGRKSGAGLYKSMGTAGSDGDLSGIDGLMGMLEDIGGGGSEPGGADADYGAGSTMGDLFSGTAFNDDFSSDGDLFSGIQENSVPAARSRGRSKAAARGSVAAASSSARSRKAKTKS